MLEKQSKLGLIRSAIKKRSKRYNETLKLCEFAGKSYQETLDKLHDQDIKYSMFQYIYILKVTVRMKEIKDEIKMSL